MTEYEKELRQRRVGVGDMFILRREVYKAVKPLLKGYCSGCELERSYLCRATPDCNVNDVIYIKEKIT